MTSNPLFLLLLVLAAAHAATSGHSECPCIDPWATGGLQLRDNAPPVGAAAGCDIIRGDDSACFASSYGTTGCAAHDSSASACTATVEPPEWCAVQWCFVDAAACSRPNAPSVYFNDARLTTAASGSDPYDARPLTYSYETCGNTDSFSTSFEGSVRLLRDWAAQRPNGKLRIGYSNDYLGAYFAVGNSYYPDSHEGGNVPKVVPYTGIQGTNRSGAIAVFMHEMLTRANVPWEEVPLSNEAWALSPDSSFTACCYEVALGGADMCWGNYWPLGFRRVFATFTGALYEDRFYLIVWKNVKVGGFVASLSKPFEPFTIELWVLVLSSFAFVGILMTWEAKSEDERKKTSWWEFVFKELPIGALQGVCAYNTGEIDVPVKSSGSWMTVFFLGFTFQVLITGYTAIVTTTLISQGTTEVKSFEEAIDKGYRICADTVIRPVLVEMYPQVAPLLVSVVSDDGYLMAMDRGECNAAILDADTWNSERMYGVTTHCENKVRLRETIAIIDNAMPVSPEILRPMSALVARNKEGGLYAAKTIEAKLNYTHNICLESDLTTEKVEFGIPDLVGPIFFLLVSSVFSVLVTRFFNRVDKKTDKMKEALDTDGDGHVSAAELRAVTGGREPTRARTKNPKLRDRNGDPASSELAILPREAPNHTTCSSLSASPKRSATEVHAEVLTVGFAQQAPADMDA